MKRVRLTDAVMVKELPRSGGARMHYALPRLKIGGKPLLYRSVEFFFASEALEQGTLGPVEILWLVNYNGYVLDVSGYYVDRDHNPIEGRSPFFLVEELHSSRGLSEWAAGYAVKARF